MELMGLWDGLSPTCSLMHWLIDGYNLMHASGAAGDPKVGPAAFRRRRRRFLNELAADLGVERARETTVVFDANSPPPDFALETSFKGLNLIFALGDENADARIEKLIAAHFSPRSLTVVSSDHRIRRAARRRKARALTADQFLDQLDRWRTERSERRVDATSHRHETTDRDRPVSTEEAAYWLEEFGELDNAAESHPSIAGDAPLLTDAEIARIQREIDGEP
jgi:predicted RNA-binding protein with PIN domain